MKKTLIIIIATTVVIGGAFYGGMKYGQSQTPQTKFKAAFQNGGTMTDGTAGSTNSERNNFVNGEVIAKDEKSVTIKIMNGGSKIVFYSESTEIQKMTSGGPNDIIIGETVTVSGKTNSDGSITAQSIQVRPKSENQ